MKNNAEQSLYDLLITQNLEPEILDSAGKPVTDPSKAELFSFDYTTENQDYGTVVILIGDNNQLEVYFGDNLGRSMEADDKSGWYDFLHQLKSFASRNMMTFGLNNIARLKYTMKGMAAIKEGLFEGYYGRKNISYSDQPKQVRLMIKHNRNIDEGEARYRAIESLFVETALGERFKLPFRNLMGGRIMARHVSEGGTPYDAFGQHIVEVISEIGTLSRFIRATRGKKFTGHTDELVEIALRHYSDLKDKAKRMISQRGYLQERDMFDPAEISESSVTTDTIRDLFIEQNVDQRIEEALPIIAQLVNKKEDKMREANEFESWANQVMEGTWALPDTPEADAKLKELMSKPLIVGADATNATEQLYDLVGDDVLFDRLNDLADQDPNANCWDDEEVINRLGELGIDTSMGPGDADADGDADAMADPEMGTQTQPELDDQMGESDLNLMRRRAGIQQDMDEAVIPDPKYDHEPPAQESDPIPDDHDDEQGVAEGNGDTEIRPGMRVSQGTVVKVNGNTVTVKTSNGDMMTMNIHDVDQGVMEGLHPVIIDDIKRLSTLNPVSRYSAYANIRSYFKDNPELYKMASDLQGGYFEADILRGKYKTDALKAKYAELEPMHQAFIKQALGQGQGMTEETKQRDQYYYQRNNIWRIMDGDELVQEYTPARYEVPGAKKLLAQFDDEGYDVTHVISPMGVVTYLYGKPEDDLDENMTEGQEDSPVASAITRRILMQRADLLSKYGPEKVIAAIDDVADFVGDTEEIGSSDVSGWVRQVEQSLGGVDEGILDTAKKIGNQVFDKLGGGSDEELLNKLRKDAGLPPRMAVPNKKGVGEDLDTDGVMMTKPSNMSS